MKCFRVKNGGMTFYPKEIKRPNLELVDKSYSNCKYLNKNTTVFQNPCRNSDVKLGSSKYLSNEKTNQFEIPKSNFFGMSNNQNLLIAKAKPFQPSNNFPIYFNNMGLPIQQVQPFPSKFNNNIVSMQNFQQHFQQQMHFNQIMRSLTKPNS